MGKLRNLRAARVSKRSNVKSEIHHKNSITYILTVCTEFGILLKNVYKDINHYNIRMVAGVYCIVNFVKLH